MTMACMRTTKRSMTGSAGEFWLRRSCSAGEFDICIGFPNWRLSSFRRSWPAGVLLNVLKEELPEQRESRYWVFALGAIGYALLLLAF